MDEDRARVATADGWSLEVDRLRAPGGARGTVLLLHAMMVDRRTFSRPAGAGLAAALRSAGLDVVCADLRGHGGSGPLVRDGARWRYEDLVLRDLPALVGHARAWGRGRLAVVGHSLGGHVTAAALACGAVDLDALVCLAANVWFAEVEPDPGMRVAKGASLAALQAVGRGMGRLPARDLRLGSTDEAGAYAVDLGRPFWDGWWGTRDGRHDWRAGLAGVRVPTLAVVARGDRLLARPAGAIGWAAALPALEVWVVGEPAGDGCLDHMGVVTDPAAATLHARLGRWLVGSLWLNARSSGGFVPPHRGVDPCAP